MIKQTLSYIDYLDLLYPNTNKKVKNITFQVTEDCNLKCSYCYQINKTKEKMTFDTAKKFIDYLLSQPDNENFFCNKNNTLGFIFDFIGGEPFLEVDLISQIIDYFEQKLLELNHKEWLFNHVYNFSSNGTLYFTEKVQSFIKKYRNLLNVNITVDGNKELHDSCRLFPNGKGSYDLAIQASLKELESQKYTGTKITLSPDNIDYVFSGVSNLISLGFHEININCCYEDIWLNENSPKLLFNELIKLSNWIYENSLYDKIYISILDANKYKALQEEDILTNWCGATSCKEMFSINPSGNIYPCIRFMETSLPNNLQPIIIGDIESGLLSKEQYLKNYNTLQSCNRKNLFNEDCNKCLIASGCSWCIGCNYMITGKLDEKINTTCEMHKMSALATKYLCKITNDLDNYEKIQLNYQDYKKYFSYEEFLKYLEKEE